MSIETTTMESMKEKFDKKYPEAKMLREMELRRTSRDLFNKSSVGKATSLVYFMIAVGSVFVYLKYFEVNILLSIFYGIVTWFTVTYIFDKILIKLSGIEGMVKKFNDEEIEVTGRKLEETLKEKGKSVNDLLE
ncbi:hypothetical protein A2886_02880 [candidate division WWE3 bacterium RIFCSPHIGHO2_01_FULL_42_13]|uniref:Uncharacterized protein n=1 Tax=candidate division WWE3 bacterium RIFCSPHIGHO2_01_FULL_42_13 TaxID=1802617 RepID=A0A1F4URV3_UNCKA|nr:MAG: hypothetical protein A2886_02880 [candidate division WWE3 bacterium RIFCSPHIGHO2_01_FULL_42_13]